MGRYPQSGQSSRRDVATRRKSPRARSTCRNASVKASGIPASWPTDSSVPDALRGQPLNAESIAQASALASEGTSPPADLNASADYKRHLAQVLCKRALHQAAGTA